MPQKMSLRAKIASLWLVSIDHKRGGEFKRVGSLREERTFEKLFAH